MSHVSCLRETVTVPHTSQPKILLIGSCLALRKKSDGSGYSCEPKAAEIDLPTCSIAKRSRRVQCEYLLLLLVLCLVKHLQRRIQIATRISWTSMAQVRLRARFGEVMEENRDRAAMRWNTSLPGIAGDSVFREACKCIPSPHGSWLAYGELSLPASAPHNGGALGPAFAMVTDEPYQNRYSQLVTPVRSAGKNLERVVFSSQNVTLVISDMISPVRSIDPSLGSAEYHL